MRDYMQNNTFYPLALIVIAGIGLYFMFGNYFSIKNVDYAKYKEVCTNYLQAEKGKYSDAEMQSLVNKVNYLLPGELSTITIPIEKDVKSCALELSRRLAQ